MTILSSLLGIPDADERARLQAEYHRTSEMLAKARKEFRELQQNINQETIKLESIQTLSRRERDNLTAKRTNIAARAKKLETQAAKLLEMKNHWVGYFDGIHQTGINRIIAKIEEAAQNIHSPLCVKAISATQANLEYVRDRGFLDYFGPSNASELRKKLADQKRAAAADRDHYEAIVRHLEDLIPDVEEIVEHGTDFAPQQAQPQNPISENEWAIMTEQERNQIRLDRYLSGGRTWWQVGHDYEVFVGQEYETKGYKVEYYGEARNIHDWGRDLICHHPDGHTLIVQCKCWARYKEIYERHIFQLYGTAFLYRREHGNLLHVWPVFVTSTRLGQDAMDIARSLKVTVEENKPIGQYKSIKCNISRDGEHRIYHLPWDQQYRKTVIEPDRGEFFAETIKEAEACGFRHAMRHMTQG